MYASESSADSMGIPVLAIHMAAHIYKVPYEVPVQSKQKTLSPRR